MMSATRKVCRGLRAPRHAGLLLTLTLLSSCVLPQRYDFYYPTALGGSQARAGEPRTLSVILFQLGEIIVGMNTVYLPAAGPIIANRLSASISIEIPEGNVVKLARDYVDVSEPSGDPWRAPLSGRIWTGAGRTSAFSVDAPMIGKSNAARWGTARGWSDTKHAAYFFEATLYEGPEKRVLTVRLPELYVNDSEVELAPITLTLSSERLMTVFP